MKGITVCRNGTASDSKVIGVQESFEALLDVIGSKLNIKVAHLYNGNGAEVDDIQLIRDEDDLYASEGEPFVAPGAHRAVEGAVTHPAMNCSHQVAAPLPVDWVTLNVGGKYFTTSRSTLTDKDPDSMLARMFSEDNEGHAWTNHVDHNGAFLVDRSPEYFQPILNYLRHGQLILDRNINPNGVLEEAKFFGIVSLVEELETVIQDEVIPDDSTPITRREFILRLLATPSHCELRCQGINFSGANLSRLDLRYINFKHANMKNVNLSGANLSYCNFERADMTGANLNGANLLSAKMVCVTLETASLQGCNFEDPAGSRANMEGANMKSVNLEGSHMAAVNLRVANLKNANLQNCDLRGAVLAGADLENCDLSGCDLQEANLRGANLKGAAFELMLNPLHMSQAVR